MAAHVVRSPRPPPHRWPIRLSSFFHFNESRSKWLGLRVGGPPASGPSTLEARLVGAEKLVSIPVTTEFDLDVLRNEIDDIDTKILELVARRIAAVVQIGDYKRSRGLPVYDAVRERLVLQRLMGQTPPDLDPQVVRRVFERIIDESRGIEQHQVVSGKNPEE